MLGKNYTEHLPPFGPGKPSGIQFLGEGDHRYIGVLKSFLAGRIQVRTDDDICSDKEFLFKSRTGDEMMGHIRYRVQNVLPSYPGGHQLGHYDADRGE